MIWVSDDTTCLLFTVTCILIIHGIIHEKPFFVQGAYNLKACFFG